MTTEAGLEADVLRFSDALEVQMELDSTHEVYLEMLRADLRHARARLHAFRKHQLGLLADAEIA